MLSIQFIYIWDHIYIKKGNVKQNHEETLKNSFYNTILMLDTRSEKVSLSSTDHWDEIAAEQET